MERVDVDPDGDIILAVSNTLELRVSSRVMSLTSPVFKAMLGPHFAEGHALREATPGTPKIISLPDDNAADMKLLCFVLHPTNSNIPDGIKADPLCSFARLVDKYGCAEAVKFTASVWCSRLEEAEETYVFWENTEVVLTAVYYLDNPFYFARITNNLAHQSDEYPGKIDSVPYLIQRLYGKTQLASSVALSL